MKKNPSEETRKKMSASKMGTKNPMKKLEARMKSSLSHKGKSVWNKGLKEEEYSKHYPLGIKGGRPKGYKHTELSKLKMSQNTLGKKHKITFSPEQLRKFSNNLKRLRQNLEFNTKMFKSFQVQITKPHRIVQKIIRERTQLKTQPNYCFKIGNRFASIDEAEPNKKIAIFVDGNYWHKYPTGRRWDKCCTTYLQNQGWIVLRLWEHEIKNDYEEVAKRIISLIN